MSKTKQLSTIFINTGNGFNKDEFEFVPLNKHGSSFKVTVTINPNVKGIRFDPYEGYACMISNLKIMTDGKEFAYTYINGEKIDKLLLFDNLDPQIAIDFNGKTFSNVTILGNICQISHYAVSILSQFKYFYKKHLDNNKWLRKIFNIFNLHILYLEYYLKKYTYPEKIYFPEQIFTRTLNLKVLFIKKIKLSYSPLRFDNDKSEPTIFDGKVYTQYAIEAENAMFFSGSNILSFGNRIIYDLPFYDNEHRFRYTDPKIIKIENKKIAFWKKFDENIEKAVWMGGCASYNYYHFLYEFAVKFLILNKLNIPQNIPVYIDQICIDIPQFKELLDIMNIKNYPLTAVPNGRGYMAKILFYINCPHIIPPNFNNDNDIKLEDVQFDISALKELRNYLLPYSSKNSFPKKIFISRKNASGLRNFNENEIIESLAEFGFEIVFPEKLSFRDQIALFNHAEIIIGGSGAAFTNILFCNEQCKCFILAKACIPLSIFSTIAHIVGVDLRYITEEATKGKSKIQSIHEPFNIDVTHFRDLLYTLNINT